MSGRRSAACEAAVRAVLRRGLRPSAAARRYGVALSTLRRTLRALGDPPRKGGRPPAQQ